MISFGLVMKMMQCFPTSFINQNGEFIACRISKNGEAWFRITDCSDVHDLEYKCLAYLSRSACKTEPYMTEKLNDKFHALISNGINKYLGTNFTEDDFEVIYSKLGDGRDKDLGYEFVWSKYDMRLLRSNGLERQSDGRSGERNGY